MKVKNLIIALLAMGGLLSFSSCDELFKKSDPTITFTPEVVEATFEGGDYSIAYTVENPVEGAKIDVVCDADWISGFDLETEGQIKFKVAKNEDFENPREATVTVRYPKIDPAPVFIVRQAIGVPPTIAFSPETVEVPAKGGDFSTAYQIENPIEGAKIDVKCEADWITDFDLETEGQILFKVAKNKVEEAREAVVEVSYPGIDPVPTFTVKQEIGAPDPFTIEVSNLICASMTVSVIPHDKEMKYIYQILETAYIEENNLSEDNSLFADDITYFEDMANWYGCSINEILDMFAASGDLTEEDISGLNPGTSYTIYAYGIDIEKAERLTDIVRYEVTTETVSKIEAKFDVDVQINDFTADVTVTPVDYEGYYIVTIGYGIEESTPEEKIAEIIEEWWMNYRNMLIYMGFTNEMILQDSGLCATGVYNDLFEELNASTLYLTIVAAVNEEALICSNVSYKFFVTDDVEPSDNVIKITVSDIKSREATITFTPSNEDTYTIGAASAEECEGFSDEDIIASLLEYPFYISGEYTEIVSLEPNTEYRVFAIGCQAGAATTQLFQESFTTPEAQIADLNVTMKYDSYADAVAVGAIDSSYAKFAYDGYVLIGMELSSEPEGANIYYGFIRAEEYEAGNWTDSDIINALLGDMPSELPYEVGLIPYGEKVIGVAVGEDENGDLGPLFIGEPVEITKEGVTDPAEWLAKYPYPYGGDAETEALVSRASFNLKNVKAETSLLKQLNIRKHIVKKHYNVSSEKGFISKVSIDKKEMKQNDGFTFSRLRKIKK